MGRIFAMQMEKVVQHFGQKGVISLNSGQVAQSVLMELGNKQKITYAAKKAFFLNKTGNKFL